MRPSGGVSTGHQRGSVPGTLLTSGNTGTDEQQSLLLQLGGPSDRVRVVRVSTIDDDVTLLEVGLELLNEGIDCGTGLDEEDDLSGSLQVGTKLLNGVGTNDVGVAYLRRSRLSACDIRKILGLLTLGFVGQKVVDLGGGSVVSTDLETLVGHVEDHCRKGDFWVSRAIVAKNSN